MHTMGADTLEKGDEDVVDAPVLQVVLDGQPESGALIGRDPGLAFADQLWLEAAVSVAWNVDGNGPIIALQNLACSPVAAVRLLAD